MLYIDILFRMMVLKITKFLDNFCDSMNWNADHFKFRSSDCWSLIGIEATMMSESSSTTHLVYCTEPDTPMHKMVSVKFVIFNSKLQVRRKMHEGERRSNKIDFWYTYYTGMFCTIWVFQSEKCVPPPHTHSLFVLRVYEIWKFHSNWLRVLRCPRNEWSNFHDWEAGMIST